MQGQRSIFDLNQWSNSNNTSMDESDDWKMLSPMERRLLNNDLSNELNFSCVNTNNNHSFSSWDVGESSSRANLQHQVSNDSKLEQQQQQLESSNIPINVNLNIGYDPTDGDDDGMGFMDLYQTGRPESESGGSCSGNWGLSCKRKTLEGTSTHSLTSGSSSFFPDASRSLNMSSNLVNPVPVNHHEPPNTRTGVEENSQTHFDPTNWSLATRSGPTGGGGVGGSRPLWTPQLNTALPVPGQQRLTEFAPWNLFPSAEVESGGQRDIKEKIEF